MCFALKLFTRCPSQLYVSVDAATKDSLKAVDRPLFKVCLADCLHGMHPRACVSLNAPL